MRSIRGDDNTTWKLMPGFFTPGAPSYNEEGGEIQVVGYLRYTGRDAKRSREGSP